MIYLCNRNENSALRDYAQGTIVYYSKNHVAVPFYNKDFNDNRAHVHVGKKDTQTLCKIWLEPKVEIARQGDLTDAQAKEVLKLAETYKDKLLLQWCNFKEGKTIRIIKIKK